ncbi:antigen 5 like allergen Cul n 1-like [Culicoides brevitarsis]|uniref:antigen 5 like allergen Cul n 1-like n=1 Tax=Culicoides brevitarsis TaxID=469753 RepID=UPI00307C590C
MKLFISIFCAIAAVAAENYCDPKLCEPFPNYNLGPHIACPGNYQNKCNGKGKEVPITPDLKKAILNKHNGCRNDLAGGRVPGFSSAGNMPEMTWDDELAFIASKNAMNCNFDHDKCRSTRRFKQAGQNLAVKWLSGQTMDDKTFVENAIDSWWNEYKQADQSVIDSYHSNGAVIGHFTQMAHEEAHKIGCAISMYPESKVISGKNWDGITRYLVCNYATTNIRDRPIYKKGSPTSACKGGRSKNYSNLCNSE